MVGSVLVGHGLVNGLEEAIQIGMQIIGGHQVLQMQPEPLDGIEKRAVLGQPDNQYAVC